MANPSPRVSVIIPVYQGEGVIADCLTSVFNQTYPSDLYEVVVVDNASTDRTADIARGFPVKLVDEPRRGVGWARNAGVAAARGELAAFIDADCIAERDWLEALVGRFDAEEGVAGVGGYLPGYDPQTPIQYYIPERKLLSQEVAVASGRYSDPFIVTANALFLRRLIEEVGGFDTTFETNGEDADLCWRIAERGWRFVFAPEAVVYHRHRSTLGALCRWMFRYGRESVYLLKKHRRRYGIGPVLVDFEHYRLWLCALGRFLRPGRLSLVPWERRFAGYDIVRYACFTAGRIAGSIRYGAIIL